MRFSGRGGSCRWTGAKVGLGLSSGVGLDSGTAVGSGRAVSVGCDAQPAMREKKISTNMMFRTFILCDFTSKPSL